MRLVQLLGGRALTIGDEEGRPLPSIVAIDRATGEAFGGRDAWNRRFELSEHGNYWVIPSIKPYLASDRQWPTNRTSVVSGRCRSVCVSAADASSTRAAAPISQATVAIPVGMSADARRQLRKAAAIAGIDVEAFVAESTAAMFQLLQRISPPASRGGLRLGRRHAGRQRRRVSRSRHLRNRARGNAYSGKCAGP